MGNYNNLNVFDQNRIPREISADAIDQVAAMINGSGKNRAQRRRLEKSLGKMETVLEHSQKYLDRSAYKHYQDAVDTNFLHFFATLAMVMKQDYKWREDETHDQISSLLERVGKKLDKFADMGYSTEDIVKMVDDELDITLTAKGH